VYLVCSVYCGIFIAVSGKGARTLGQDAGRFGKKDNTNLNNTNIYRRNSDFLFGT